MGYERVLPHPSPLPEGEGIGSFFQLQHPINELLSKGRPRQRKAKIMAKFQGETEILVDKLHEPLGA